MSFLKDNFTLKFDLRKVEQLIRKTLIELMSTGYIIPFCSTAAKLRKDVHSSKIIFYTVWLTCIYVWVLSMNYTLR